MSDPASPFVAPTSFTTRPNLRGNFGMTGSTHWIASSVAQAVLERGGNAFDAATAAGFVLHVVEPHLNGPGGDMVAIAAPTGGEPRVLMGQGPAPAAASVARYRAEGLELVPGSGALAAAVPGAVDAWLLLLRDHGTWEVDDVLSYAIHYAETGHEISAQLATMIDTVADLFRDHWPASAAQWMPDGSAPAPGTVIRRPEYADTLRRLVASASGSTRAERIDAVRREWKTGFVAAAMIAVMAEPHRHSTGGDHAGVMTADDIAGFAASWERPASITFRGTEVVKQGVWGQGPALLIALALLDGFDDAEIDPSTPDGAHRVLEALKLALADRDAHFGDVDDPGALLSLLLDPDHVARRRALIGETASHEFRPSELPGRAPFVPPLARPAGLGAAAGGGEPTVSPAGRTRGDTCHVDVVDRWGNMISATPSGGWLQSSPHIPGLGFCLGTRLQMTWLDESSPAALRGGRRPRTTLTPTVLRRRGVAVSALGTPGGDQQDQWQLLYLLRTLVGGYEPQQAIDAPAFHTTSMPGSFWPRAWTPGGAYVEGRFSREFVAGLEARGHVVTVGGDWSAGRLTAVVRDPETGLLQAAANPRGAQGYAVGR